MERGYISAKVGNQLLEATEQRLERIFDRRRTLEADSTAADELAWDGLDVDVDTGGDGLKSDSEDERPGGDADS
ncbi:hypothetical protein [Natrinema gelatinilyticum]|uniref:hypothetical protein n=1 Tax=Natrinema gelatinilyticum TaxID=2961571 RepID=UPI0020C3C669|nr:hypothetical protein [Natrinema gelatinilyticum]